MSAGTDITPSSAELLGRAEAMVPVLRVTFRDDGIGRTVQWRLQTRF